METKDLAAAIAYFEEQAELSPFAAQVEGYLKELQQARRKLKFFEMSAKINADAWAHQANICIAKKQMKVYKMSVLGYYGDAYIAAETEEQAKELTTQYKGFLNDNRIFEEFPKFSANVDNPQVILNALHVRIGSDATQ